jgi:hypothetical protein
MLRRGKILVAGAQNGADRTRRIAAVTRALRPVTRID